MFDHVTLNIRSYARGRAFYEKALEPLGYSVGYEWEKGCGFGVGDAVDFWIREEGAPSGPTHVAFRISDRRAVAAFHEAGLAAGGRDNGAPGPRPQYGPTYYAAFVLDPDGNNVEAVCHAAE